MPRVEGGGKRGGEVVAPPCSARPVAQLIRTIAFFSEIEIGAARRTPGIQGAGKYVWAVKANRVVSSAMHHRGECSRVQAHEEQSSVGAHAPNVLDHKYEVD